MKNRPSSRILSEWD